MLVFNQDILDDKIDPLGHINLEEKVVSHKFIDDLIDGVVEFIELFKLIVLSFEDVSALPDFSVVLVLLVLFDVSSLEILSHEEQQLEEKLTDT